MILLKQKVVPTNETTLKCCYTKLALLFLTLVQVASYSLLVMMMIMMLASKSNTTTFILLLSNNDSYEYIFQAFQVKLPLASQQGDKTKQLVAVFSLFAVKHERNINFIFLFVSQKTTTT